MQARQVDTHLLMVFEALLAERSVTRAAANLNLSQPATSKALGRLRLLFGDPLFVRDAGGITPTHRALELAPLIRDTLHATRRLLDPDAAFDPATDASLFKIAASDYVAFMLLPQLLPLLAGQAPQLRVTMHDLGRRTAEELLAAGQVDLALASVGRVSHPLQRTELFRDRYVCIARRGHPVLQQPLDIARFAACSHLVIPRQNGGGMSVVDDALAQHGLTRGVMLELPHFLALPGALEATDLVATVPRGVASHLVRHHALDAVAHPLDLASFVVNQIWHCRSLSPSHCWLREQIAGIFAAEHG